MFKKTNIDLSDQKGIALVMVLILSVIALAIMSALVYMLTTGTQISGMQKRYKTALDAGVGGVDITYEMVANRGNTLDPVLIAALTNYSVTTPNSCVTLSTDPACTAIGSYTGISTKLNLPTACWSGCDNSISIIPGTSSTYDMAFQLGAGTPYTIFSKIVDTKRGNSGGDEGLLKSGVVASNSGEITMVAIPYLYTIELDAQNITNPAERAKLSILYQY